MIRTIGLFLIAAGITWLATPATLAIYFNGIGFQGPGKPVLFVLLVPLTAIVVIAWLTAIKQYKRLSKENDNG